MKKYYLAGIGGIGMCGLAQLLVHEGISVIGSDRSYDRGENKELFNKLEKLGIKMAPQDGSGISTDIEKVIISRAVEENNPDIISAKKLNVPVSYRQDELKKIFRKSSGIAVAGTSGKTTVVGMISCVLSDINVINGGIIKNYETKNLVGNVRFGKGSYYCIETDESEGNLKGYFPNIGVITNIGKDHMSDSETIKVYNDFSKEVKDMLVVKDGIKIKNKNKISFSIDDAKDLEIFPSHSLFKVNKQRYKLNVPGLHNVYNALAAIKVSYAWGVPPKKIAEGLKRFNGIKRRFELVSDKNGIRVVDDYAHNPDKIRATLETAKLGKGRLIAVYQPHGYGPLRMFLKELAQVFAQNLRRKDFLFVPDVYYAGGTVNKDISSEDLVKEIKKRNKLLNASYVPERENIKSVIRNIVRKEDLILIMGARDTTLHDWAKGILE